MLLSIDDVTEAANQATSRPYPPAGLILRSNSLQKNNDDQTIMSSALKQSNVERTDSRGRIQETKSREIITSSPVISTQVKTLEDTQTVKSSPTTVTRVTTITKGPLQEVTTTKVTEVSSKSSSSTAPSATSFLDDTSKVTGVQDILNRMRNADLVTESSDTSEDAEARALLNKFLGASVILQGMEQGMRSVQQHQHTTTTTTSSEAPSSAALVIQAEKQRVKDANTRTLEDDIDEISDEKQLRILLEACSDYEGRRKIRARLRTIMADHKGAEEISEYTTGLGNNAYGVGDCSGVGLRLNANNNNNNGIDDSGAESGEEIRVLKPEVIQEVQTALTRLENVLPGLDPSKRDAVSQLVNSLQTCLKIPPPNQQPPVPPPRRFGSKKSLRNRHTVGVTREELADARRWIDEAKLKRHSPQTVLYSSNDSLANKVFRPVKFVPPGPVIQENVTIPPYLTRMSITKKQFSKPLLQRAGYFMEPGPQNGILSYIEPEPCLSTDRSTSDTGSLYDYDPSINLFTPEQSVQIAVHKAAINKQISREESRRRGSSEDGDVSSADEENNNIAPHKELSSAQRLLQLATDDKTADTGNSNTKNSKKLKMKRSNTIDIPKPANFYDYSSDDYGDDSMRKAYDDLPRSFNKEKKIIPTFEPKTENDLKFLSFLKQVNQNDQSKVKSYNPCARGGKHWQNRFSSIKTAFESNEPKSAPPSQPSSAKLFWQNAQNETHGSSSKPLSRTPQPGQSKLPWTVKTEENGVVVGSLTVAKPGHVNHFKHAAISAFKPIEKKPTVVSPVSGSVKQIAAQKFSVTPTPDYPVKPEKIYKTPQPMKNNNLNYNKADNKSFHELKNFALNSNTTEKTFSSAYFAPKQEQKPRGAITSKFLNEHLNNAKPEQTYAKDNQSAKVWSYSKPDRKEPIVTGRAQFKTLENQTVKDPVQPKPSYALNTGRMLEKFLMNKNPTEQFPAQHWSTNNDNNNFVHYNNVSIKDDKLSNSYKYGGGNVYSNLPFNGDHLPSTVQGRGRTEVNGHNDVRTATNIQNSYQTKTSTTRSYFNDLNTRNGSLVNFTPPSTVPVKEKQRYSLPENKLIEQYKDTASKSNESIDRIRPLELRIPQQPVTDNRSNYHQSYNQQTDKKPAVLPRPPDSPAELKMPGNIEFCTESPSSYLLSPDENSCSTPQLYSPYDSQQQKVNISPQFNQYPQSPQNINTFPESSSPMKFTSGGYKSSPHDSFISISQYEAQHSKSPSIKVDESNGFNNSTSPYYWQKDSSGDLIRSGSGEFCTEEKAVTRVMGQAQCQQAITINNRTKRRFDSPKNIESELKLQLQQSARQKTLSPSFPNVLQKSESWHQMVKEQMYQAKQAPPLPKLSKAKSTHTLALPKQFEAALAPESVAHKKITVSQYLAKQSAHSKKSSQKQQQSSQVNRTKTVKENLDDDLENVDEVFESIFQESNKKRNSK